MVLKALSLLAVVFFASVGAHARNDVAMTVTPRVAPAPATVRIMVVVEPDPMNRWLVIEAESGMFYTSSSVQLEGANSRRSHPFTFVELPPGNYELMARVLRSDGEERRAVAGYLVTR